MHYFVRSLVRAFLTPDASDIPKGGPVTEKQPVAKTRPHSASGFSGDQCPVDEDTKTEDAATFSEESPPVFLSGFTCDQGMELH